MPSPLLSFSFPFEFYLDNTPKLPCIFGAMFDNLTKSRKNLFSVISRIGGESSVFRNLSVIRDVREILKYSVHCGRRDECHVNQE